MKRTERFAVGLTLIAVGTAAFAARLPISSQAATSLEVAQGNPGSQSEPCRFRVRVANVGEDRTLAVPAGEPVVVLVKPTVGGESCLFETFFQAAVSVVKVDSDDPRDGEYVDYFTSDAEGFKVQPRTTFDGIDVIAFNLDPGTYVARVSLHNSEMAASGDEYTAAAEADLGGVASQYSIQIAVK